MNWDNPFELSPFEVNVDEMGYGSNFSTTGTRVSEAIDRLPFSVSVVTKDIMEDFLADTLEQQFAYTSAFSPGDTDLTSQIRGIAAPGRLRNGFFHYGLTDRINTRRVEVIKGPVASIYGKAQPGGILNYITETPTEQEVQRLGIYAGTNGYRRLDAVSSGPLVGKDLLYFIGFAAQIQQPPVEFAEIERLFGAASVEYRFGKSRIRTEVEVVRNDSSPVATLPYYYRRKADNPTGPRVTDDYALEFYNFNNMGPEAFEKQRVFTGTITLEHAFSKNANLRLAANHYDFSRERLVVTGDLYLADPDPNQRPSILSRSPSFRPEDRSQSAVQGDLLLSGQWGDTEARLLITGDYSKEKSSEYFLSLEPGWDKNANHPFFFVRQLFLDNPDYRLPKVEDLTHRTRDQSTDTEIFGAFLSGQLALWRGKLIAMSGARYDYARYRTQDLTAGNFSDYNDSDSTYQIGVNFAVLPRTRLYSNYSTSFFPQARLSPEGLPYPNEQGVGYEFGIKGDIGDGKLYYTVAVFDVTRKNIVIRTRDEEDQDIYLLSGKIQSKGFEVDFHYNVLRNFEIKGGYGYVDAQNVQVEEPRLMGLPPARVPRHNLGMAANYRIQRGPLRGMFVAASVRHLTEARGSDSTNALRYLNYQPAYTVWNMTVGYRYTSPKRRIYNRVQITLNNVTDERYLSGRRRGEPRNLSMRWEVRF